MPTPPAQRAIQRALMDIPNVGPSIANDLIRAGVYSVADVGRWEPLKLYEHICKVDGVRHDPCLIDCLMAAVHFARTGERRVWWDYTPLRKQLVPPKSPSRAVRTTRKVAAKPPARHRRAR